MAIASRLICRPAGLPTCWPQPVFFMSCKHESRHFMPRPGGSVARYVRAYLGGARGSEHTLPLQGYGGPALARPALEQGGATPLVRFSARCLERLAERVA